MNPTDTSSLAYKKLQKTGSIEDRETATMQYLREMGGAGTAFDIMRHVQKNVSFIDDESRFRFVQSIHATCSNLNKQGLIKCVSTQPNPTTGQEVKYYEINEGDVVAQPTVDKGYKKRFEALQIEMAALTKRGLADQAELEVYRKDSIKKDRLADVYYEARSKVDWDMILNLFTKK